MARACLKIDTEDLTTAGRELRTVHAEFSAADANADHVASMVGHSGLADVLSDFSRNWDDKRGKMLDSIGALADQATTVGKTFVDIERDLCGALQGRT